jgi:dienelactone hydrolase
MRARGTIAPRGRLAALILASLVLSAAVPAHGRAADGPPPVQEPVMFPSGDLKLRGVLARPPGTGPWPAYIHVHGSMTVEAANGPPWTRLTKGSHLDALAHDGFVVLLVARRGHRGSEGTTVAYHVERRLVGDVPPAAAYFHSLEIDAGDLAAAVEYLRGLPFVDAEHIAVGGHSLGGVIAVLAAARDPRIRGVVSLAGGWTWTERGQETAWGYVSTTWRDAAKAITAPVLIMWSRNDVFLSPDVGRDLEKRLQQAGRPVTFVLYPPFGDNGHHLFNREAGYPVFTADLVRFLHTTLRASAR